MGSARKQKQTGAAKGKRPGAGPGRGHRKVTRPWLDSEVESLLKLVKERRGVLLEVSSRAKKPV
jgi:hypothetical protein